MVNLKFEVFEDGFQVFMLTFFSWFLDGFFVDEAL